MRPTPGPLLAIVLVFAAVATVAAQEAFRVTFDVDRGNPEQTQVVGTIFNDSLQDMFDVSVTAEAFDGRGRVVARGISFVASRIPGRGSMSFVAKVPAMPSAVRYRAFVSSYRAGMSTQTP